jgi:heme exporter protein A
MNPPDPAASARLEVDGITKSYGPHRVLSDVSFRLSAGESVGLAGPNGAGKSTLLRILAGLNRPSKGRVLVDGTPSRHDPRYRQRLGYVSHEPLVYPHLSARENLLFYADLYDLSDRRGRADALLDEVDLSWAGARRVQAFSRGMVQRLTLARALLHAPDILLLDEPHTGLDPEAAESLGRILAGFIGRGGTLLIATHELHRLPGLVGRLLVLHRGRLRASRTVDPGRPIEDLLALYREAVSEGR